MAVQSQDIASLFKELEDASKLAKLEEKDNKKKTDNQVKELDSFLTSVQKVVKVIEKKDDDTPIKPKKVTPKVEKKSKPNGKIQEQSKKVETKSLSEDDTKKLDAFSGLIKSFGVEIKPEIVEEDLQLQVEDVKPVVVEPKIDESKKLEALENLFSGLNALKPEPKIDESLLNTEPEKKPEPLVIETKTPEPVKPVVVSQTPVDIREAMKLVKENLINAYNDGENLIARTNMLSAALMGATAFQKGLGAIHSLSHPIGAIYNTHHGTTNAVVMENVVKFNKEMIVEKVDQICNFLSI